MKDNHYCKKEAPVVLLGKTLIKESKFVLQRKLLNVAVLQGLSARLHLLQILQIHLTRVWAVTRRYTHHFSVETLF